nr:alpha/beta hydrolase [Glycomyces xiaoerkulensis]
MLALHAAPMAASSFEQLANELAAEYTVLTMDPRGIAHSTVADRGADVTPETRADDLARVIEHVDAGPAAVLGSSGGAVSALALAQQRPDLAPTVIAHEPPLAELLPDRLELRRSHEANRETYLSGDRLGYWKQFLATAGIEMPDEAVEEIFGGDLPEADARDERYFVERMELPATYWRPDIAVLRETPTRVLIGIGGESAGQFCDRTSRALAEELSTEPVLFPGGHTGFVDEPGAFAACLREVLAKAS